MRWAVFGFWGLVTLLMAGCLGVVGITLIYFPAVRTWETYALAVVLFIVAFLTGCFTREAWGEMERE